MSFLRDKATIAEYTVLRLFADECFYLKNMIILMLQFCNYFVPEGLRLFLEYVKLVQAGVSWK